jgi:hypothetical protein
MAGSRKWHRLVMQWRPYRTACCRLKIVAATTESEDFLRTHRIHICPRYSLREAWPLPRRAQHLGRNSPDGYLIKAFERIGIFADQQYQGGGLRVGFGSALFPFLESSLVDPQLAGEDGTRAAQ